MKFRDYLTEKYKSSFKTYQGEYIEVFENPSLSELIQAAGDDSSIRYSADPRKKKVYVWSVESIHHNIQSALGISEVTRFQYLHGTADRKGSKFITIAVDAVQFASRPDRPYWKWIIKADWSWLKKYNILTDKWITWITPWLSQSPIELIKSPGPRGFSG